MLTLTYKDGLAKIYKNGVMVSSTSWAANPLDVSTVQGWVANQDQVSCHHSKRRKKTKKHGAREAVFVVILYGSIVVFIRMS